MEEIKKLAEKIDMMQKDIDFLKVTLGKGPKTKKVVSLKGVLKGIKVEEEDVEKAKKSLFKA